MQRSHLFLCKYESQHLTYSSFTASSRMCLIWAKCWKRNRLQEHTQDTTLHQFCFAAALWNWFKSSRKEIACDGVHSLKLLLPLCAGFHNYLPNLSPLALKFSPLFLLFIIQIHQRFKGSYVTNLHFVTLESSRVWILMLELAFCHVFMSKSHWSFLVSWVLILCTSFLCCNLQLVAIFELSRFRVLCFWLLNACSKVFKPHYSNSSSLRNSRWWLQCSFFASAWSTTKSWSWFMAMDLQMALDPRDWKAWFGSSMVNVNKAQ
jgi:hypothetical protein